MRAATNMRPAIRPVEYWVRSPRATAALVVVLAAATEEVAVVEESVVVANARVLVALAEVAAAEEVVVTALAFLEPQSADACLQARWPSASLGCELMHWP